MIGNIQNSKSTKQSNRSCWTTPRIATTCMLAVPLLLTLAAIGCGEQKKTASAELATTTGSNAVGGATAPAEAAVVATAATETGAAIENAGVEAQGDGSLPPDIVAMGPETVALPGTVVTIAAVGSPDVSSVVLTDRAGARTPFTYDSESNLWRAAYRVPLRAETDKLGLSVTATTEANRWKRVWVFLQLKEEDAKPVASPSDSAQ